MSFTTLVHYRENTDEPNKNQVEIIPIDSEDTVEGLEAFGAKPISVQTDGKKLVVNFDKTEVLEPFQKIQASLAGATQHLDLNPDQKITVVLKDGTKRDVKIVDLFLIWYAKFTNARQGWKGLLTMMRSIPIQK